MILNWRITDLFCTKNTVDIFTDAKNLHTKNVTLHECQTIGHIPQHFDSSPFIWIWVYSANTQQSTIGTSMLYRRNVCVSVQLTAQDYCLSLALGRKFLFFPSGEMESFGYIFVGHLVLNAYYAHSEIVVCETILFSKMVK